MTNDLRTRIAAVQREHRLTSFGANYVQCECGWKSPEKYATWTDHPEHVADAVIREAVDAIDCGGCRGLGGHSPRCHTQPGYQFRRAADMAERIGDLIGSSDTGLANEAYRLMGELRLKAG